MKKPGGTKWKKWQHGFLCSQYYLGYFTCILQDYSKKYYNISFPYINRWTILAMQQLRNDYSITFPPLSIARYSFIQLSRLRRREVKENAQTSKR